MTDVDIRDLVIKHDAHIDTLANSIEQLAIGIGGTNTKMENILDLLSSHNVLEEKISNMDKEVKEAFDRMYNVIREIKENHHEGCVTAQQLVRDKLLYDEKIKVVNNRIKDLETEVKGVVNESGKGIKGPTLRWLIGVLILQSITFGTYVVVSLHSTDLALKTYMAKDIEHGNNATRRLDEIIDIVKNK